MLRNARPRGINPLHASNQAAKPPPPTKAELTAAFIRSSRRLGLHVYSTDVPGGLRITLFDFAQGDAHVREDHAAALDDAATFLLGSPSRRVFIIGNADKNESRNEGTLDWLSIKRAQRVWSQLSKRKVPKSQIFDLNGHGVMGAGAALSNAASGNEQPGKFRMVELNLMYMTLQDELRQQQIRIQQLEKRLTAGPIIL
ncbi:MAG: OmpA family protein [Reyranellaceae bacterium]